MYKSFWEGLVKNVSVFMVLLKVYDIININ